MRRGAYNEDNMTQSTRNLSPLLAIAFFALAGFFPASSLFAAAPFNPGHYILGFQEAALTSGEKKASPDGSPPNQKFSEFRDASVGPILSQLKASTLPSPSLMSLTGLLTPLAQEVQNGLSSCFRQNPLPRPSRISPPISIIINVSGTPGIQPTTWAILPPVRMSSGGIPTSETA